MRTISSLPASWICTVKEGGRSWTIVCGNKAPKEGHGTILMIIWWCATHAVFRTSLKSIQISSRHVVGIQSFWPTGEKAFYHTRRVIGRLPERFSHCARYTRVCIGCEAISNSRPSFLFSPDFLNSALRIALVSSKSNIATHASRKVTSSYDG